MQTGNRLLAIRGISRMCRVNPLPCAERLAPDRRLDVEDRRPARGVKASGPEPCLYEGCRAAAQAHGLCADHLRRLIEADPKAAQAVREYHWVVHPGKPPCPMKMATRRRRKGEFRPCMEAGCERPYFCRGMCHLHYQRWFTRTHRTITVDGKRRTVPRDPGEATA